MSKNKAVVLLSGGLDSVATLLAATHEHDVRAAVYVSYGQRQHRHERACAEWWCRDQGVGMVELSAPALSYVAGSGILANAPLTGPHPKYPRLSAAFIPGRNVVLLTLAAAVAVNVTDMEQRRLYVWAGMCGQDSNPDSQPRAVEDMERTLTNALAWPVTVRTPLMSLSKAETFRFVQRLGRLDDVLEHTHTCYNGDHETRNVWGYGCGTCDACKLRAEGYRQFYVTKPFTP